MRNEKTHKWIPSLLTQQLPLGFVGDFFNFYDEQSVH